MKQTIFHLFFFLLVLSLQAQEQISVMSYNIRLGSVDDGENHWNIRKQALVDLIDYYEPDFLGTQEGQQPQLDFMAQNLPHYSYVGKPRTNDPNGEFTAIFYRTDKFEIVEQNTFWMSETPEKISKGWDAAYERISTYVLFKDKTSKKLFWMMNTHFDHIGKEARRNSALMMISKMEELKKKKDVPIFLTGDFNAVETDEPIQVLKTKLQDTKNISEKKVYGPDYSFTGFKFPKNETEILDYIFIYPSTKVKVKKVRVISDFYANGKYPSDHFPILTNFDISK